MLFMNFQGNTYDMIISGQSFAIINVFMPFSVLMMPLTKAQIVPRHRRLALNGKLGWFQL